jgi:hypothetical protein
MIFCDWFLDFLVKYKATKKISFKTMYSNDGEMIIKKALDHAFTLSLVLFSSDTKTN